MARVVLVGESAKNILEVECRLRVSRSCAEQEIAVPVNVYARIVHIERYFRDSMENEKSLTWNRRMLEFIQEMIHKNNTAWQKE